MIKSADATKLFTFSTETSAFLSRFNPHSYLEIQYVGTAVSVHMLVSIGTYVFFIRFLSKMYGYRSREVPEYL